MEYDRRSLGAARCGPAPLRLTACVREQGGRKFSKRIAAWGICCLMGTAIYLLLSGAGLCSGLL
jgi:hypothetical protein